MDNDLLILGLFVLAFLAIYYRKMAKRYKADAETRESQVHQIVSGFRREFEREGRYLHVTAVDDETVLITIDNWPDTVERAK